MSTEAFYKLPSDAAFTGPKVRHFTIVVGPDTVWLQATAIVDCDGNALGTASAPIRTDPVGSTTQPVTAAALPLPAGAATETTLAGIKTGTDKIPVSPATDRTTAAYVVVYEVTYPQQ
jgi:hypothetical protein